MENMDYEIDLREIFQMIKEKWFLLVSLTVVSVLLAGAITLFYMKPVYQTSSTLLVSQRQNNEVGLTYNDLMTSQKLVNTYSEIIKSRTILDEVIYNLNLDISSSDLVGKITVSPVKDTEIISITVKEYDAELAMDIANEIATVFKTQITNIMQIDSVSIVDSAILPNYPSGPNLKLNVAIAGVLGLMLGLGIIFLMKFLDRTLKSPTDVEKYLGLPIIGAIPDLEQMDKRSTKAKVKAWQA